MAPSSIARSFRSLAVPSLMCGFLAACGSDESSGSEAEGPEPPSYAIALPASAQSKGDPAKGYDYLVNGNYQTLGAPWSGFSATMTPLEPRDSIPGRRDENAITSYMFNVVTDPDGVKVAGPNCLACHATHLNGQLIIGLGRPNHMIQLESSGMSLDIPGILLAAPLEAPVALRFATRFVNAITQGVMDVFPKLASHHDPKTLAWNDTPLFDSDTALVGWVDIPPWWRVKKKNALYYTGTGRGEQGRHMSFMSVFSVRDTAEAEAIEEGFVDVAAYIASIEPPSFPGNIDRQLAGQGEQVFLATCATCHGTYGDEETYPNVVIPVDKVGTDPSLATDNWINQATIDWFNGSFYAGTKKQAWMEHLQGYYAPPLDGIWATAPFFHNGSVPTLDGVIDPQKRPAVWTSAFGDDGYDLERVGWRDTPGQGDVSLNGGKFDCAEPGNSNQGHTFGAALSEADQRALLEYLKTL